jgi:NAD-dependent dihydropyrimidine dehydrogenase PreA subunit
VVHVPYVITEPCIGKKDGSCVEVCPVDAIHPGPTEPGHDAHEQLYIDPTECIDCGACEPCCPHEAIYEESDVPQEWRGSIEVNARFFQSAFR